MSNKGIFRGWDNSSLSGKYQGGSGYYLGDRDIGPIVRRLTRDELIYTPVAPHGFVGTANPMTTAADILPGDTAAPFRHAANLPNQLPQDGSVVGVSVTVSCSQSAVGTPAFFVYDYDGQNADNGAIVEGSRIYTGKVAAHSASLNWPFVRTGGMNNLRFKYAVDWGSGTFTAYCYITGYWTRAPL